MIPLSTIMNQDVDEIVTSLFEGALGVGADERLAGVWNCIILFAASHRILFASTRNKSSITWWYWNKYNHQKQWNNDWPMFGFWFQRCWQCNVGTAGFLCSVACWPAEWTNSKTIKMLSKRIACNNWFWLSSIMKKIPLHPSCLLFFVAAG